MARPESAPSWRRVAVVADLHLGAEAPATSAAFLRWLRDLEQRTDALLILGDLFEAWVGDDQLHSPQAQTEADVCAALRRLGDAGVFIGVQHGNRDFLLGAEFAAACAASLLPDPWVLELGAQRLLLTHGDALCLDDTAYLQWRTQCRAPAWQQAFLALPLDQRMQRAQALRAQSRAAQAEMAAWADADAAEALRWMKESGCDWMIHGHTHRPREHWADGRLRQVLADWDLDHAASPRAQVLWLQRGPAWVEVRRERLA